MSSSRLLLLPIIGVAVACTAPVGSYDLPTLGAEAPRAPAPTILGVAEVRGPITANGPTMSVVFTDGPLDVRAAPNADAEVIGSLDPSVLDHPTTRYVSASNRELWRLVTLDEPGTAGWAPARNLTEFVPSEDFCESTDSWDLLTDFEIALVEEDRDGMLAAVSPAHGLEVRWLHDGAAHHFDAHATGPALSDGQAYDWGHDLTTDEPVLLSFRDVALGLRDALRDGDVTCGVLVTGTATYEPALPRGQERINYFSVHVPASELGVDWVTYTIAVTHVEGVPYVAGVTRYVSDN